MTTALILGFLWVIASAVTAMLPMPRQMVPGVALLLAAPVLMWFIAADYGIWVLLIAAFAFGSMFRNPLIYFARRAMGLPVTRPVELQAQPAILPDDAK